jgi:hypothetical protein
VHRALRLCLHLLIVPLLMSSLSRAQTKETTSVTSPRPVREVILQWEKQYGWVIPYEDPRFVYDGDLEDITEKVRRDLKPGEAIAPSKRIIGARERQLSVTYDVPKATNDDEAKLEAVKQLVNAFSENAGTTFLISQSETRVHVSPGMVRDVSGKLQPSRPMLDTIISVPAQERNGGQFLHALCDALTAASGYTVFVGLIPSNDMHQFHTNVGYENVPTRQALENFLDSMPNGDRYTWALLFQKDYALNIHWVKDLNQSIKTPSKTAGVPQRKFE